MNYSMQNSDYKNIEVQKVPQVIFKTRVRDENVEGENKFSWLDKTTDEIFLGKKVVLFSLPGAFTPTCSSTHLPGYENNYQAFKDLGVDEVICLSVNDAFVMFQWGKAQGANNVVLLPDGNADFTKGMGMLVKKENLGFGNRSWRYSMVVEDGTITKMFIEEGFSDDAAGDPFEISDTHTILNYLKGE